MRQIEKQRWSLSPMMTSLVGLIRMKKRVFPFDDNMINDYFNKYLDNTKKE